MLIISAVSDSSLVTKNLAVTSSMVNAAEIIKKHYSQMFFEKVPKGYIRVEVFQGDKLFGTITFNKKSCTYRRVFELAEILEAFMIECDNNYDEFGASLTKLIYK